MDDQIGRVVEALDKKGMRDNTLILFQSDNGGTRNPMFSGEVDTSTLKSLPPDNGPYREGKGTVYEGGTRVVGDRQLAGPHQARDGRRRDDPRGRPLPDAARPGRRAARAEASRSTASTSGGRSATASPARATEIVYDLQPFRAGIRQGDWKLVWRTPLPQAVELYNIAKDPSEKDNVAAAHPDKVAALQQRANELAAGMVPPLMLQTEFKAMKSRLSLPPALPDEDLIDGAAE